MDIEPKHFNENADISGWSKYQLLVLQSLDDHTQLLKGVVNEINDLKQKNAIAEVVKSSSQKTNDDIILGLKTRLDDIEDKLAIAVNSIENSEQDKKIQTRVGLKLKALWGLVGGGLIIAADVIFKLADFWFQKKP